MAIKVVSFAGNNGVGVVSVPGVLAGDEIVSLMYLGASNIKGQDNSGGFAKFVETDGEIIQLETANRTAFSFCALLRREVIIP